MMSMLAEGDLVGSYRVVRKLGEGGMGAVFIGEHTLLGRQVAIKVLLPMLSAQQEIVRRFFNEAKAVTRIADPGIVQVFDFGYHTDGSAFIVMELLEGEAMDRRLARIGRFSPAEVLRLMRLICMSIAAAHAKGIVHRDLKPENIFLVGDPAVTGGERAKILDFGIAKLSADEPGVLKTRTGMMMGTPVYMSPEQCRGISVDRRSDIYSIGCVMMTMLTGRPPFVEEAIGDLIAAHLREPPPLATSRVPGLPEVFDQFLQRCLAKVPDERFATMADLGHALGHAEQLLHGASAGGATFLPGLPTPPGGNRLVPSVHGPGGTTLTGAVGQATARVPRRTGRVVGAALAGMIAVVATVVGVSRSQVADEPEHRAATPRAVAVDPPLVRDAGPASPVATENAAAPANATLPSAPSASFGAPDAGHDVASAAAEETVPDAGSTIARPYKDRSKPTSGRTHAPSSGSDLAVPTDRGD